MQETRNNCFGLKKRGTTLIQAKTGKQECRNVTAIPVLTCFRLKKGRVPFFRPETIVASFLHLMVLFFKALLNHSCSYVCVEQLCIKEENRNADCTLTFKGSAFYLL